MPKDISPSTGPGPTPETVVNFNIGAGEDRIWARVPDSPYVQKEGEILIQLITVAPEHVGRTVIMHSCEMIGPNWWRCEVLATDETTQITEDQVGQWVAVTFVEAP